MHHLAHFHEEITELVVSVQLDLAEEPAEISMPCTSESCLTSPTRASAFSREIPFVRVRRRTVAFSS